MNNWAAPCPSAANWRGVLGLVPGVRQQQHPNLGVLLLGGFHLSIPRGSSLALQSTKNSSQIKAAESSHSKAGPAGVAAAETGVPWTGGCC